MNDIQLARQREKERKAQEIRWSVNIVGKGHYPDAMTYVEALEVAKEIGGYVVDIISQENLNKIMLKKDAQESFHTFVCKKFEENSNYFIEKINEMAQKNVDLINLPYKDLMLLIIETLGGNTKSLVEFHDYNEEEHYEENYLYVFSLVKRPDIRQDLVTVEFLFDHNDCTTEEGNYYLSSCQGDPNKMLEYAQQLVSIFQQVL